MFGKKESEVRQAFKDNKLSINLYYQYCIILERQIPENEDILFLLPTFIVNEQGKKEQSFFAITSKNIIFILGNGVKSQFIKFPRSELRSYSVIERGVFKTSIIRFEFLNKTIDIFASALAYSEKISSILDDKTENKENESKSESKKTDDPILVLERLAQLRDNGIITESDFNEKKNELLNKI